MSNYREKYRIQADVVVSVLGVLGVIPPQDHDALREAGAVAIFGPGTVTSEAALALLELLAE